jgi:DNA repair protein RadD
MLDGITLRSSQVRAIEETRAAIRRCNDRGVARRVLLVGPCGMGKTITSSFLMASASSKGKTSIFLADRRQLVYQKSETLKRCGVPHAVLMAGEDYWHSSILVASKETYFARAVENAYLPRERRDLWIVDEAHAAMGASWRDILTHQEDATIVGLTATPALANGKGLGEFWNEIVIAATYEELLAAGVLVPARVFQGVSVDTRGLKKQDGDWSEKALSNRWQAPELVGDILDGYRTWGDNRPFACFAQSVAHSVELCREFNAAGIRAIHVDAETPQEERQAAYDAVRRGEVKGLCNYGILTVGFDLPCLGCGILAFATASLVKYLQVCGRIIRSDEGKRDAIIIDHGGNVRRHGWPTEDHNWSLDATESTVTERDNEKAAKEENPREPICCPNCGAMRERGPECASCGHKHKKHGEKIRTVEGKIVEVTPKELKKQKQTIDKGRLWAECIAKAANRNGTVKMAAVLFKQKAGHWPPRDVKPMPEQHERGIKLRVLYPGFAGQKTQEKPLFE